MTVIGFVSAGLVTFPQAIGVLIGATFGTTTTPWMVAFFGFRVQIASFAMPMVGVGAFLWLIAKGRLRAFGAILAGFGLIFVGLDYLQTGMGTVSWNIDSFVGDGWAAKWLLAGIGVVMTIVMQSSSAAAAATLVALHAGNLNFHQACAMVVGQSVGTAATSAALGAMSGGLAVWRAALAHIIFSLVVGLLGMLLLIPLANGAGWLVSGLDDYDGVLALAAFSSLFKLMGVLVFFPWLDTYARLIVKLSGKGADTAVNRLQPALAEAGGPVALEAVWRALQEVARGAVDAVARRLAGEQIAYQLRRKLGAADRPFHRVAVAGNARCRRDGAAPGSSLPRDRPPQAATGRPGSISHGSGDANTGCRRRRAGSNRMAGCAVNASGGRQRLGFARGRRRVGATDGGAKGVSGKNSRVLSLANRRRHRPRTRRCWRYNGPTRRSTMRGA